ncbi:Hypothetical predicted protein [Xyrichtys novacula]|uniref:Uncharacterized protein n=1 Tax=Xyrichtys novacula TaxID=13765 RepID=A0AAV1F8D2_XYRNO|nr:Hypothetical predicted protein [Xyrichtys novacula]
MDTLCDAVTDDQGGGGNNCRGCMAPVPKAGQVAGLPGLSGAVDASGSGDGLLFSSGAAAASLAEFRWTASRRNLLRAAEDAVRLSEWWTRRVPGHRACPGTDEEGSPSPVPGHTGIPPHASREVFFAPEPSDAWELVTRRGAGTPRRHRRMRTKAWGLRRVAMYEPWELWQSLWRMPSHHRGEGTGSGWCWQA